MTRARFLDALDRYGPDLSRWPSALRPEAARLLDSDPEAARHHADAGRVAARLAEAARPVPIDAAFVGGLLDRVRRTAPASGAEFRPTLRLAALASVVLTAAFAAGFAAGYLDPLDQGDEMVAALLFGGGPAGVDTGGRL
jgi:hypothetical protein